MLYAGYSPTTRPTSIESPSVKAAFSKLIRKLAPAHVVAGKIAEGLNATETKFFQKDGVVTDRKDVVNWSERRQYAQLAAEYGEYVEKKDESPALTARVVVEHIGEPGTEGAAAAKTVAAVEITR